MHNAQFIHDYEFYEFYELFVIAKRFYKAKRLKELYELFFNNGFRRVGRNIDKHDNSFRAPEDDFTVTATEKILCV